MFPYICPFTSITSRYKEDVENALRVPIQACIVEYLNVSSTNIIPISAHIEYIAHITSDTLELRKQSILEAYINKSDISRSVDRIILLLFVNEQMNRCVRFTWTVNMVVWQKNRKAIDYIHMNVNGYTSNTLLLTMFLI